MINKITIQNSERFIELESYQKYLKEKAKIQKKYKSKPWEAQISSGQGNLKDPFEQGWWDDWCKYKKDMIDILFKPNSNFQQFLWDIISEQEEFKAQIAIKGIKRSIYYK